MDQKFEGQPQAQIRVEGRKVIRTEVAHDWGSRLQWRVKRDGQVVATPSARLSLEYEHPDAAPGKYEVALQIWHYVDYKKDGNGEYVNSKFVEISNTVEYQV